MANPQIPLRIRNKEENQVRYPNEITHSNGMLYFTDDEGKDIPVSGETADLEARLDEMELAIENINYKQIEITSFGHNKGTQEYNSDGTKIESVVLSWNISKTPEELYLDGVKIEPPTKTGSKTIEGLSIVVNGSVNKNKTWTLKAVETDPNGNRVEVPKNTSITFYNGVYYGKALVPSEYNSDFIKSLSKELRSNKKPSFNVTTGEGEYMYYCLPKRMGTCKFTVGGFEGGFKLIETIAYTNPSGYTEDYYIYKSDNGNLGQRAVSIV